MNTIRETVDQTVILIPGEKIDAMNAPEFEKALLAEVNAGRSVVIDLSNVTYLSSGGLGVFVKGAKRAGQMGCRVGLCGLHGEPKRVFQITNLQLFFEIFPTRAEAVLVINVSARLDKANNGKTASHFSTAETSEPALTLPEEILLLALQEDGRFIDLPDHALDHALAGALLMELCLRGRIDLDLHRLISVNTTSLGDDLLDPVLNAVTETENSQSAQYWVRMLVRDAREIRRRVIDRLVNRNILEREATGLRRVLRGDRHPMVSSASQQEVRQRVLAVLRSTELPMPRDVVIIALAEACSVFDAVVDEEELMNLRPRILEIAGMDLLALSIMEVLVGVQREGDEEQPTVEIFSRASERAV